MKQKRRRVLLGALGALLLLTAAVLALSHFAKAAYWAGPHLQELHIDMGRYADDLDRIDASQSALQDMVRQCNEAAVPLPAACADYVRQCNQLIAACFLEVYSVDVHAALDALQVRKSTYPEEVAGTVGGSFSSELEGLFINAALLDSFLADAGGTTPSVFDSETFSFNMLRNVYTHEAIHALGFSDDPTIASFMEAITEALTQQVMEFHSIPYENLTGYMEIKELAAQIIDADPDMIRRTLQEGSSQISAHMAQVIGAQRVTQFDDLVFLLQRSGCAAYREVPYLAQYIVYEYEKAVAPYDLPSELSKQGTVRAFELRWFLTDGRQ